MTTITTRAGKGSPLTNNEVDANFTNLNDDKIENVVEDTTPQLGGSLDTNGNDITFGDNDKAIFGAGSDLEIYHSGAQSFIADAGTGGIRILADADVVIGNANNTERYADFNVNGAVNLRHDNSTKFSTTSTGIDVNGDIGGDTATISGDLTVADESSYKTTTQNLPDIRPSLNLDFANTKKLDPRIDFTRTTTATYYDGVTHAKAEENLWRQSEFTSGWFAPSSTLSFPSVAAPDGTNTAAKFVANTSLTLSRDIRRSDTTTEASTTYTVSVFGKILEYDTVGIRGSYVTANDWISAEFDLTNETATLLAGSGSTGTNISADITDVGNGWYRCSYTFTTASGHVDTTTRLWYSDGTSASGSSGGIPNWAGNDVDGIYLWGAQLEQRSSLTAYTPTTDQPITNYVPALQTAAAGEARFDHDPITGESLGLLVEEQRTNLFGNNDNIASSFSGTAQRTNFSYAYPQSGALNFCLVQDSAFGNNYRGVTASSNTQDLVISFRAKKRTPNSTGTLTITNEGGGIGRQFTASEINGDTWTKIIVTTDYSSSTGTSRRFDVYLTAGNTSDGQTDFMFGEIQVEEGDFVTSYIHTTGSQATRNADSAEMTGTNFSSWYRQDEGSFYSEALTVQLNNGRVWAIADTTDPFDNRILHAAHSSNHLYIEKDDVTQASIDAGSYSGDTFAKAAVGISRNDCAVVLDGGTVFTDSTASIPTTLNAMYIGANADGNPSLNGTIKKLSFYPKRLPNATLQALTEE